MNISPATLHVFTDQTDSVIADDEQDAERVWEETVGEKRDAFSDPFTRVPDEQEWSIELEGSFQERPVPAGALRIKQGDNSITWRATCRAWADTRGRGFLCSTGW